MLIIMPTFEEIKLMPPTIAMINCLVELGHEIIYITIFKDDYNSNFNLNQVKNISLSNKKISLLSLFEGKKILGGMAFRIDNIIKKIIVHFKLKQVINKHSDKNSILWVVNEMTVLLGGIKFLKNKKYIFSSYELHEKRFSTRNIMKAAENAEINVVPEYNRAHIMKTFFSLKRVPFVLPNKPYYTTDNKSIDVDIDIVEKFKMSHAAGKKIILYMGRLSHERPIEHIIKAYDKNKFDFFIMGRKNEYLSDLVMKYADKITYLGQFVPPLHLKIAAYADIGILIYTDYSKQSPLNSIYCAPNKIYEYADLGLPMLCNDIPGLKYNVEKYNLGKCIDIYSEDSINEGLNDISEHYEEYMLNSKAFFYTTDVKMLIKEIIYKFQNEC